jgi:hypothetical protein
MRRRAKTGQRMIQKLSEMGPAMKAGVRTAAAIGPARPPRGVLAVEAMERF